MRISYTRIQLNIMHISHGLRNIECVTNIYISCRSACRVTWMTGLHKENVRFEMAETNIDSEWAREWEWEWMRKTTAKTERNEIHIKRISQYRKPKNIYISALQKICVVLEITYQHWRHTQQVTRNKATTKTKTKKWAMNEVRKMKKFVDLDRFFALSAEHRSAYTHLKFGCTHMCACTHARYNCRNSIWCQCAIPNELCYHSQSSSTCRWRSVAFTIVLWLFFTFLP